MLKLFRPNDADLQLKTLSDLLFCSQLFRLFSVEQGSFLKAWIALTIEGKQIGDVKAHLSETNRYLDCIVHSAD